MARLRFEVLASYIFDTLRATVFNPVGTPQARINGGPWQSMPATSQGFLRTFPLPAPGTVLMEYQDDDGVRTLCNFLVVDNTLPCRPNQIGFGVDRNVVGKIDLSITDNFAPLQLPLCVSIDGGATEVCGTSSDPTSSARKPAPLNIPPGVSTISQEFKTNDGCVYAFATDILVQDGITQFSLDITKTDVTTVGGSDGTITVTPVGGSGNFQYAWADSVVNTPTRTGLPLGGYTVTVTDQITGQVEEQTIFIDQPGAVEPDVPGFFEVPKTQSLHFVIEPAFDFINTFPTPDNQLLSNQRVPDWGGFDYAIKKNQADNFNIQFRSNLPLHECQLFSCETGEAVASYIPQVVVQNTSLAETFNVRLQNNGSNQTRVYFVGETSIPLATEVGDFFEIFNNGDGFNGNYAVVSINIDAVIGQQYLVINQVYNITAGSSVAKTRFLNSIVDFNIWEFTVSFASISRGYYYMAIRAFNDSLLFDQTAFSEPISIEYRHPNTHFIEFTNIDNANDIDYQNNITHRIRVESVMYERQPEGESDNLRNSDGSLVNLSFKPQRKFNFRAIAIPPYLQELLLLAYKHDVFRVNGVRYKYEENSLEIEYREKNVLSDSNAIIEQAKWFETFNGDDLGGLTVAGGFVLANNGFIKRT